MSNDTPHDGGTAVPASPQYNEKQDLSHQPSSQDITPAEYNEAPRPYSPPISTSAINNSPAHEKEKELVDPNAPVDPATLTWDGPDDPENPKNWPVWIKWYTTIVAGYLCLIVTFGSSVYTTGLTSMTQDLHVSQTLALSGLTFYLIGLSVGPLVGAPLSELYGRKPVYLVSMPLSMLFIMGSGLSNHYRDLAVTRFFTGLIASPAMAVCGGTVSDLWPLDMICVAMCIFSMTPFAGTILGPIIGGFVEEVQGWKWTMWLHLIFMGSTIPFILTMRETFAPAILKKRAAKRGIVLKKSDVSTSDRIRASIQLTILQPLKILIFEPTVLVLSIYTAFIFSILFGFFEAYPIIYSGLYGMSDGVRGLTFIAIGIGLVIAIAMIVYVDRTMIFPKNADGTRGKHGPDGRLLPPPPESLLLTCKIGAVLFPVAMFWQAWTAREGVHPMAPIAAGVLFGISVLSIFLTVLMYFSFSYPPIILASVISANNVLRYGMASVFPLFVPQMYNRLGISWASSLFGFLAILMMPLPFIFAKYGAQLRAKSRFNNRLKGESQKAGAGDHEAEAELELAEVYSSQSHV